MSADRPRVLILGGGFAGVGAAKKLEKADAEVVLVDRHATYAHNDPNSASPKNDFVKNLLPFLRKLERK